MWSDGRPQRPSPLYASRGGREKASAALLPPPQCKRSERRVGRIGVGANGGSKVSATTAGHKGKLETSIVFWNPSFPRTIGRTPMRLSPFTISTVGLMMACSDANNSNTFGMCNSLMGGVPAIEIDKTSGVARFDDIIGNTEKCAQRRYCLIFPFYFDYEKMIYAHETGVNHIIHRVNGERSYAIKTTSQTWSYLIDRDGRIKRLTLMDNAGGESTTYHECLGKLYISEIPELGT